MGTNQRAQVEMAREEISTSLAARRTATLVSLDAPGRVDGRPRPTTVIPLDAR